jgi:hypothetical protein
MKAVTSEIEDKLKQPVLSRVERLMVVLDKDIQHIQDSLSTLEQLRSLLIKRDDAAMDKLLENIRADLDSYAANDLERRLVRKELASVLGFSIEQMTLSKLEAVLTGDERIQVADKKRKLTALISELRKEYLSTALLLSECARFNNLLFRSILDLGKVGQPKGLDKISRKGWPSPKSTFSGLIYSSDGSAKRQTDMNLVSLKF